MALIVELVTKADEGRLYEQEEGEMGEAGKKEEGGKAQPLVEDAWG